MDYRDIKEKIIKRIENDIPSPEKLRTKMDSHPCYGVLEIKDFMPSDIVNALAKELESIPLEKCKHFTRRGSNMYEHNFIDETPIADSVIQVLNGSKFLKWLEQVTGNEKLIPDPHLTGASYMKSFAGDSLKVHTDFNWVEELRLYRMLSIIIYLNPEWEDEWKGHLNFYDTENNELLSSIKPDNGNLLLWNYHELAFHGYPEPIQCPEKYSRKGLRLFYYASNSVPDENRPAHKSLYWYDEKNKVPYNNE